MGASLPGALQWQAAGGNSMTTGSAAKTAHNPQLFIDAGTHHGSRQFGDRGRQDLPPVKTST